VLNQRNKQSIQNLDAIPAELMAPSGYSVFKRLANLGLVIAAIFISLNLWIYSAQQDNLLRQEQADQLGHSILKQAHVLIASYTNPPGSDTLISSTNKAMVSEVVNNLQGDIHVHSAALYALNGKLVAKSSGSQSLLNIYKTQPEFEPLVYVSELYNEGQPVGYLRLLLDEDKVMRHHNYFQEALRQQIQIIFIMALAMGFITARAFYKFRYRHIALRAVKRD
jgi:membrane protein